MHTNRMGAAISFLRCNSASSEWSSLLPAPAKLQGWMSSLLPHLQGKLVLTALVTLTALPCLYHLYHFVAFMRLTSRNAKAINLISGDPTHWFYGNLKQRPIGGDPGLNNFYRTMSRKHKKAWRTWIGPLPHVTTCHPDTMRELFRSSQPKYTDLSSMYMVLMPWLGDGLLLAGGSKWFHTRRLLTPAFHFDILKGYMEVYNECSDTLISKLHSCMDEDGSVEICEPVRLCTLDIILKCAFSYDTEVQTVGKDLLYVKAVSQLTRHLLKRLFNPLAWASDFIYFNLTSSGRYVYKQISIVHKVADEIISKRRQALIDEEDDITERKRYLDFLDILLKSEDENGTTLTDLEIRNEVDTFLFAGHDTTSSAISWILYELASHPQIQEKATEEIDELLANRNTIQWDDLTRMPYLTQCIKESLRKNTAVPVVSRQLETRMEIDGVTLLPGTIVELHLYSLHHNPLVWGDDHNEYKPERFDPENVKNMDPFGFVPFSAGPRNCIGQNFAMNEIKVVVAKLLQRFRVEMDATHDPCQLAEMVMKAKHGIKLHFSLRH